MSTNEPNSSPAGDPTLRTNVVTITDLSSTIDDVQSTGVWMVSAGQPSNPPPKISPNYAPKGLSWTIEFDAGRQDTTPVAQQFNTLCGGANNEWTGVYEVDTTPSQLNFYFGLSLNIASGDNSTPVTVYLGQGNWSFDNNWWIGGSCISNVGKLSAVVAGETVTLTIEPDGNSGFIFNLDNASNPEE